MSQNKDENVSRVDNGNGESGSKLHAVQTRARQAGEVVLFVHGSDGADEQGAEARFDAGYFPAGGGVTGRKNE